MKPSPALALFLALPTAVAAQTHVSTIPSPGSVDAFAGTLDFVDGTGSLVLVGAPGDDTGGIAAGRAYLVHAVSGAVQQTYTGSASDALGSGVAELGDVTGDGLPEMLVGAPEGLPGSQPIGEIHVFEIAHTNPVYTVFGAAADERIGSVVDGLGDVNGDGLADWLGGSTLARGVRIYDGATGNVIHDATGQQGFFNAAGTGDVDGDGIGDYVYAHVGAGSNVELRSGLDASILQAWDPTVLQPSQFDGFGIKLDITGAAVAGDANADGTLDIVVGLPGDNTAAPNAGRVSIFSGADGSELHRLFGTYTAQGFGAWVSEAGDLNLDGFDDVFEMSEAPGAGIAVAIKGLSGQTGVEIFSDMPLTAGGSSALHGGRNALDLAVDLNGDGRSEFIYGDGGTGFLRAISPVQLPLRSEQDITFQNSQFLDVDAGVAHAGEFYLIVGGFSGTAPGVSLGAVHLPLNPDAYTQYSATHPNQAPLFSTFGVLDATGRASATIDYISELAGLTLHHAFVTIAPSGALTSTSNALPLHMLKL